MNSAVPQWPFNNTTNPKPRQDVTSNFPKPPSGGFSFVQWSRKALFLYIDHPKNQNLKEEILAWDFSQVR